MAEVPKPPTLPVDVQLAIFNAIQGVHEKLDTISANVRERNDDVLALKQRQNRHGQKLRRLENAVFETRHPGPLVPAWQMRPPAPSKPEWDPEDTSPHMLAPDELARIKLIAERDRKDSDWRRTLPRDALLKGFYFAAAIAASAAFTYLAMHH